MADTLDSDLDTLKGVRIFFGHQSVGENILDGVRDLLAGHASALNVRAYEPGVVPAAGDLLHARVGKNEQPVTKCDDFRRVVDEELFGAIDIALLKFCYIDINERTDAEALAASYRSAIDDLAGRHPAITFVAVTSPLRHSPTGAGVWLREMLGRTNRTKLANERRHAFNELIRRAYAGSPLFDLAACESTHPDGRRTDSLIGAYTDDGGHLNAAGRKVVAAEMIHSLAEAARVRHGKAV